MTREAWVWCGLAILSLFWFAWSAATDDGLLIPVAITSLCAICAANTPARDTVSRMTGRLFSGSALRSAVILFGALMLIQLLPVEMALLMAGDVLAYVEALAAVSLIAANTRLRPALAGMRESVGSWLTSVVRPRGTSRATRTTRPPRRPAPADDADGRGLVFA